MSTRAVEVNDSVPIVIKFWRDSNQNRTELVYNSILMGWSNDPIIISSHIRLLSRKFFFFSNRYTWIVSKRKKNEIQIKPKEKNGNWKTNESINIHLMLSMTKHTLNETKRFHS